MVIALSILAAAAAAAASPAQAGEQPATEQHGDWTLRCAAREGLPPCEIVQAIARTPDEAPLVQMSLAYAGRDDRFAVQFALPLGLLVQGDALVRIDDKTELPGYRITRCEATGCFIDRLASREDIAPYLAASNGLIAVRQSSGQPLAVNLSFQGLTEAAAIMIARNEAWAKNSTMQAPAAPGKRKPRKKS